MFPARIEFSLGHNYLKITGKLKVNEIRITMFKLERTWELQKKKAYMTAMNYLASSLLLTNMMGLGILMDLQGIC